MIGRYDRILAKMMSRIERVSDRVAKDFKGTSPFDKEELSVKERIYKYNQITPEIDAALRKQVGDEDVDLMHINMQKLMRGQK